MSIMIMNYILVRLKVTIDSFICLPQIHLKQKRFKVESGHQQYKHEYYVNLSLSYLYDHNHNNGILLRLTHVY